MIRIIGPAAAGAGAIGAVFEQAMAAGASEPSWAVVADSGRNWVGEVASTSADERARGVVVVHSEDALVLAIRLGIGGALWLPPSTAGAAAALAAANAQAADVGPSLDPWLADLVSAPDQRLDVVTWNHREFWRCQVGERRMAALLALLAADLGALPLVLPWPALLLPAGGDRQRIEEAWEALSTRFQVASEGISVIPCGAREGHCGAAAAALSALATLPDRPLHGSAGSIPRAVWELPSGRRVGAWSPTEVTSPNAEAGWCAAPVATTEHGFVWRMAGEDGGEQLVEDAPDPKIGGGPALRVPGWIASEAGWGRPAGILVERLAAEAVRRGVPLWVPNVDQSRLQFVLRLPGRFWVDGPAVPEPETTSKS